MKLLLTIISFSLLLSQQLQVDGNLKVTGEIDAQGQAIKNVGVPQSATDAVNLATAQGLAGMKPERIYKYEKENQASFSFTVPEGKIWILSNLIQSSSSTLYLNINGSTYILSTTNVDKQVVLFSGDIISEYSDGIFLLNIYEYSIQSSGTDQGMDYIVP